MNKEDKISEGAKKDKIKKKKTSFTKPKKGKKIFYFFSLSVKERDDIQYDTFIFLGDSNKSYQDIKKGKKSKKNQANKGKDLMNKEHKADEGQLLSK